MNLNMNFLMKFMILMILITSKSQVYDFISLPDALTQSVHQTIKSSKKWKTMNSSIFSTNFIFSIHINLLNNNITSSVTQQNSDQLLQQVRNLLKLVFQQIKVVNQSKLAININAIDEIWQSEDLSSLATEEKNFSKEQ